MFPFKGTFSPELDLTIISDAFSAPPTRSFSRDWIRALSFRLAGFV
jgi:hypothetical protein